MIHEWGEYPLGELVEIYDGPHATPAKEETGPIFLGISNLMQGRLDLSSTEHLSEEDFVRWTHRVTPRPDDIVFSYETRLGEAAILPSGIRCCLGRRMGLLRARPGRVDPRFLLYAYLGPEFQETLRARTIHGSTVDRIPLIDMPEFLIRIPANIDEQRAIAHILGTLDDKIELNWRMNETLDAMARAIFKSWFVDFDPVRAKSECRDPALPKHIADLFPDCFEDSELGEIPKDWHVRTLGDVLDVKHGFAFGGEYFREEPQGDILLTPGNFAIGGGFKDDKFKYYDGPLSQEFVLTDGDLLVTMTDLSKASDTLGYPAFVPAPQSGHRFLHNQRLGKIVILKPNRVNRVFLYRLFCEQQYRDEILASATGTTVKHTSPGRIKAFKTIFPPPELMALFERVTQPQHLRATYNRCESTTLTTLRDALLPKLISGELGVKDVESVLEPRV